MQTILNQVNWRWRIDGGPVHHIGEAKMSKMGAEAQ